MSFLDRIRECNTFDPARYRPFTVDGETLGQVRADFAETLCAHSDIFDVTGEGVALKPYLAEPGERSEAVGRAVEALAADGALPEPRGELYPVTRAFGAPVRFLLDRSAVPFFGVRAFGLHVNGYVRAADGVQMWIGRRAGDRAVYPDRLDNLVAGGQPAGLSLADNLVKEAEEEASIPAPLARQAVPVGALTYCYETEQGLKPDTQFCYDLELDPGFTPVNQDGEVVAFFLWPVARVAEIVRETQDFKPNCNLVIIDFMVRHGLIAPDEADYVDIVKGLHQ